VSTREVDIDTEVASNTESTDHEEEPEQRFEGFRKASLHKPEDFTKTDKAVSTAACRMCFTPLIVTAIVREEKEIRARFSWRMDSH
jgi:hypothetical protein